MGPIKEFEEEGREVTGRKENIYDATKQTLAKNWMHETKTQGGEKRSPDLDEPKSRRGIRPADTSEAESVAS